MASTWRSLVGWVLVILLNTCYCLRDPYEVLRVRRHASTTDIRRSYKDLVKELHPDRNPSPEAASEFAEVVTAYQLLIDPERKDLYDNRGLFDESASSKSRDDNQFNYGTSGGSFHFPFSDGINYLHKESISGKTFETTTLPKSYSVPQLLLFYSDYCAACARAASTWRTITEELSPLGVDVATVHAERERTIARRMGVSGVPAIVVLMKGMAHILREHVISPSTILSHVRSKFNPAELLVNVNSANMEDFISPSAYVDNRVRVLMVTDPGTNGVGEDEMMYVGPNLKYLILAFQYRERAQFGITNDESVKERFGLNGNQDHILLFKEVSAKPVATLSMPEIPYSLMKDLLENHKFLVLPRLSSQSILETLCPVDSSMFRRRLCVVLIAPDDLPINHEQLNSLREFAATYVNSRVRFAYVFKHKQQEFVQSLQQHSPDGANSNLVVIWRQDKSRVSFEWAPAWQNASDTLDLETLLERLLTNPDTNYRVTEIKELTDEHAQGFLVKVFKKINVTMAFIRNHLTRDNVIQITSLVATILFIVAGGFIMAYLVRLEEESILAKASQSTNGISITTSTSHSTSDSNTATVGVVSLNVSGGQLQQQPDDAAAAPRARRCSRQTAASGTNPIAGPGDLRIHELRGETYNGLVRLIKPGCWTLVLLVDADSKPVLLPKFQKCVWPYRKNKQLQFCFMHVDRGPGLNWYKQLLLLSLSEQRSLNINPRNCVGTVLSLNGHKRCFCVFHATLPGGTAKSRTGYRNGAFLGLDDSDDSTTSEDEMNQDPEKGVKNSLPLESNSNGGPAAAGGPPYLFTNHLLDNLPHWLDRMFAREIHRYQINYWPEFPFK